MTKEQIAARDRAIFDAGFAACRAYGDNHFHFHGAQADKVFESAMLRINAKHAGERVVMAGSDCWDDRVPTVHASCEMEGKFFISDSKGPAYLSRSGRWIPSLGRYGTYEHYHDSEEAAKGFVVAMQHCPIRDCCPKCRRPFATVDDMRRFKLWGLCPTRYMPRDPDAAKDCAQHADQTQVTQ